MLEVTALNDDKLNTFPVRSSIAVSILDLDKNPLYASWSVIWRWCEYAN